MMDVKSLAGKPVEQLSEQELATLESELAEAAREVSEHRKTIEESERTKTLAEIGKVAAKVGTEKLGWKKLPKLTLKATGDGKSYNVTYGSRKKKAKGEKKAKGQA